MAQRVLRLRHADREVAVTQVLELPQGLGGGRQELDAGSAVDLRRDRLDLEGERHLVRVEQPEVRRPVLGRRPDRLGQRDRALATVREVCGNHRIASAGSKRHLPDGLHLGRCIGRERVDGHDRRDAEHRHVLDLLGQVCGTLSDRLDVLLEEGRIQRLAGDDPADPAVHLERPDRGDHDGRIRPEAGRPALDVEELLGAHVGPEAGFGDHDVVRHQRQPVRDDRVVAVGDVRERPGVDEGRPTLQRLEQVRLDRVAQQDGHRAGDTQVLGRDRGPGHRRRQHDPPEARPQVLQVRGQGQHRHDL